MEICLLADLHFGVHKADTNFMNSQMDFYKNQLVPELNKKSITDIIILGDVFDSRNTLNVNVINEVIDLFKNYLNKFNIKIIVGNHDSYLSTDINVNSLKILELLDNITVYHEPTEINLNGKSSLMLPWITDYTTVENTITKSYDYCFCHADIIGFNMGGGRLSETGIYAKTLLNKFNHVFSGHYHDGITRTFELNKTISYIGAPYQLTRIDRDQPRGYRILNTDTDELTLIENQVSAKYIKVTYPDVNTNLIKNNIVDLVIPAEFNKETKKIDTLFKSLMDQNPLQSIDVQYLQEETPDIIDIPNNLNIISMFNSYLEQLDTNIDKTKIHNSFMELYNTYKNQT